MSEQASERVNEHAAGLGVRTAQGLLAECHPQPGPLPSPPSSLASTVLSPGDQGVLSPLSLGRRALRSGGQGARGPGPLGVGMSRGLKAPRCRDEPGGALPLATRMET